MITLPNSHCCVTLKPGYTVDIILVDMLKFWLFYLASALQTDWPVLFALGQNTLSSRLD